MQGATIKIKVGGKFTEVRLEEWMWVINGKPSRIKDQAPVNLKVVIIKSVIYSSTSDQPKFDSR